MLKNLFRKKEEDLKIEEVISRRKLTEELFKYDTEYGKEWEGKEKNEIDFKGINIGLEFLEDEINLSKYSVGLDVYKGAKDFVISNRQYNCFLSMLGYIYDGKLANAYHELCDYIDNYNDDKQLSINEKVYISLGVEILKSEVKKVCKENEYYSYMIDEIVDERLYRMNNGRECNE